MKYLKCQEAEIIIQSPFLLMKCQKSMLKLWYLYPRCQLKEQEKEKEKRKEKAILTNLASNTIYHVCFT